MPAHDVHAMRKLVSARDKALAAEKPFDEAVKYLRERYGTDTDTCEAFVRYLRGIRGPDGAATKSNPVERRHSRFDEALGRWVEVPDEEERPAAEEEEEATA